MYVCTVCMYVCMYVCMGLHVGASHLPGDLPGVSVQHGSEVFQRYDPVAVHVRGLGETNTQEPLY